MIRIIIERRCKSGKEEELAKLLLELRTKAMRQPGYISSETLRSVDDPLLWLVVSTWVDVEAWRVWEAMPDRLDTGSRIEPLLATTRKVSIFEFVTRETQESIRKIDN